MDSKQAKQQKSARTVKAKKAKSSSKPKKVINTDLKDAQNKDISHHMLDEQPVPTKFEDNTAAEVVSNTQNDIQAEEQPIDQI